MSTLETQYKNYLKENPESTFTFEEWSDWKFSNMELPPHNGLRPLDEHACSLGGGDDIVSHLFNSKDWDVTLMDGLENEPYVSDDFQIGPDGAYEHIERELDFQAVLKTISSKLKTSTCNNGDISDIGNEIGMAVGLALNDMKASEISVFIFGLKHGISLTNGTH